MERIGFVGTGVMGASMAGHLLEAGYPLNVHNRTKERAAGLVERGAVWHDGPGSLAAASDVVITIVGFPDDVEQVYLGRDGILEAIAPGSLAVDMTTSSPALARRLADLGAERDVLVLDAPVSGGDRGAREATLAIMVGGDEGGFERALPVFEVMGRNIRHLGPAGAGQHTKMSNQIAIAAGMLGVCEAMAYADAAGLDPAAVLQAIETGAAGSWSLSNLMPRALRGDFAPGFKVKHFLKDLRIAVESAREMGLHFPGLAQAIELYERLEADGRGEDGTQALLDLYLQGGV
jgi:3-hydroxyisobutyrate dehydrogenase